MKKTFLISHQPYFPGLIKVSIKKIYRLKSWFLNSDLIAQLTWKFNIQNLNWIFNSTETKILTLSKIGLRNINKKMFT